jgi:uncharacterized membrane protein
MTTDLDNTEQLLCDILAPLAAEAQRDPDAACRIIARWKRRERKRRLIIGILIAVIFTAADAIGLWTLNQSDPGGHIIFSDSSTVQHNPIGHLGQP